MKLDIKNSGQKDFNLVTMLHTHNLWLIEDREANFKLLVNLKLSS